MTFWRRENRLNGKGKVTSSELDHRQGFDLNSSQRTAFVCSAMFLSPLFA